MATGQKFKMGYVLVPIDPAVAPKPELDDPQNEVEIRDNEGEELEKEEEAFVPPFKQEGEGGRGKLLEDKEAAEYGEDMETDAPLDLSVKSERNPKMVMKRFRMFYEEDDK